MANPIPSTLGTAERDATGAALQASLVDLVDLSLVAKQAHWNLVGRQFHDVHLHLDELVNTAREYSDKVAERMAAIGVSPDARAATVASNSAVAGFEAGWIADRDVIRAMFEALDGVARGLRPRIDETEKTDLVTQDLLIELVGVLEEARWMWQAQNVGYEPEALPGR
jgi:starvation-inducible DNA-binding protein